MAFNKRKLESYINYRCQYLEKEYGFTAFTYAWEVPKENLERLGEYRTLMNLITELDTHPG